MIVSIITVCYNSEKTIENTIQSVLSQKYSSIEYIIVDGKSTDQTLSIIEKYKSRIDLIISEKDGGIYDAINKGIKNASGDIIGLVHADDVLKNNRVITNIMDCFVHDVDIVYGDIEYISQQDTSKVIRKWKSKDFNKGSFKWGWMPPHTGLFIRKKFHEIYGYYSLSLGTSADYELMLRMFEIHNLKPFYLPIVITCMRAGGVSNSSFKNRWLANRNDKKAWEINELKPLWFTFILKPLRKIPQFLKL
jgi:glycosyltransferase